MENKIHVPNHQPDEYQPNFDAMERRPRVAHVGPPAACWLHRSCPALRFAWSIANQWEYNGDAMEYT